LENYRLLQESQAEIGGALSCQQMLAFLYGFDVFINVVYSYVSIRNSMFLLLFICPAALVVAILTTQHNKRFTALFLGPPG